MAAPKTKVSRGVDSWDKIGEIDVGECVLSGLCTGGPALAGRGFSLS